MMTEEEIVDTLEFMTKTKFGKLVEDIVMTKKMPYIDAVIYACEQNGIEIEDSRKYVSVSLKQKIESEAMDLNFLEKNGQLPID